MYVSVSHKGAEEPEEFSINVTKEGRVQIHTRSGYGAYISLSVEEADDLQNSIRDALKNYHYETFVPDVENYKQETDITPDEIG